MRRESGEGKAVVPYTKRSESSEITTSTRPSLDKKASWASLSYGATMYLIPALRKARITCCSHCNQHDGGAWEYVQVLRWRYGRCEKSTVMVQTRRL